MQREEEGEDGTQNEKTVLKPYQFFLQGRVSVCYLLMPFEMPNGVENYFSSGLS